MRERSERNFLVYMYIHLSEALTGGPLLGLGGDIVDQLWRNFGASWGQNVALGPS